MCKLAAIVGVGFLLALSCLPVIAGPDLSWVTSKYHQGDFRLVSGGRAAEILISANDFKVVRIAAADLALDVERVTGQKPAVNTVLKIYMIDAGVVLDKIVVDTGGARPSYLGARETRIVRPTAQH